MMTADIYCLLFIVILLHCNPLFTITNRTLCPASIVYVVFLAIWQPPQKETIFPITVTKALGIHPFNVLLSESSTSAVTHFESVGVFICQDARTNLTSQADLEGFRHQKGLCLRRTAELTNNEKVHWHCGCGWLQTAAPEMRRYLPDSRSCWSYHGSSSSVTNSSIPSIEKRILPPALSCSPEKTLLQTRSTVRHTHTLTHCPARLWNNISNCLHTRMRRELWLTLTASRQMKLINNNVGLLAAVTQSHKTLPNNLFKIGGRFTVFKRNTRTQTRETRTLL